MATLPEPPLVNDVSEIAEKIRFARLRDGTLGRVVFLIGAGCSISAGIPGAIDIAKRMACVAAYRFGCCDENAKCVEAYKGLIADRKLPSYLKGSPESDPTNETIDWYKVYDELFRRHFTTPGDIRDLFSTIMSEADGAINWVHLCLGELVAQKYVSTVLTTNFDQLVLSGMVRAGVLPVVCDGIESLHRVVGAPHHPQLVELHGSRHTYRLRNAPVDVAAVGNDFQASAAIPSLLQFATTFVAVGYGGREKGVMDLLIQAAKVFTDKNLFWVDHSPDPNTISDKVREFLATSRNGRLFPNQDADRFFLDLCQSLKIGAPFAILEPLETAERLIYDVSKSKVDDPDIGAVINVAIARLNRLKESDKQSQGRDPVAERTSAIRQMRLAGDHAAAYRLAEEALK